MLWLISVFLSMKYFAVSTTVYRLCNEGVTKFKAFEKKKNHHQEAASLPEAASSALFTVNMNMDHENKLPRESDLSQYR